MNKKIIFSFFIFAICAFTFSCKKKDSVSPFYIKIKKNGTWSTWTKHVKGYLGPDGFDPTFVDLGVTGENNDGSERIDITLQQSGTSFSTGTYDTSVTSPVTTSILYTTRLTATTNAYDTDTSNGVDVPRYLVNITSITPTTIEGTFTGNLLVSVFDDTILEVTEGEFKVERIK